ncbi:MAG: hypothetical protein GTO71_00120, partial [Woeseiaceae bacterium]|nr:hypothetical protein [Woeseiaceae bacterium]NIP19526.1 hypothetical protein [Woeseiaceae bacterium]NIS88481.1 hypothetical protein [Woeseiaceae bacterium]
MSCRVVVLLLLCPMSPFAATLTVTDGEGNPLATAMVTRIVQGADVVDTSDNGYPRPGLVNRVTPQHTRFTDAAGTVV